GMEYLIYHKIMFETLIKKTEKVFRVINKMIQEYCNLNVGPFNQETYDDILNSGIYHIQDAHEKSIRNALKSIKNKEILKNMLNKSGYKEQFRRFEDLYLELTIFPIIIDYEGSTLSVELPLDKVSIVSGTAKFSSKTLDYIKSELCTVYFSDNGFIELFKKLESMVEIHNQEILPALKNIGYLNEYEGIGAWL